MKKSTELVRWVAPNVIVADRLVQKKDTLTLSEKLWVYNDLVWLGGLTPFWLISLAWVVFPLTMHGLGVMLFLTLSLAMIACVVAAVARTFSHYNSPIDLGDNKVLSRQGRIKWVKYDNNRKRMPHAWMREKRPPETDQQYRQYSVWVYPQGLDQMLMLLCHRPRGRFRRYALETANVTRTVTKKKKVSEMSVDPHTWRGLMQKAREMGWNEPYEEYQVQEKASAVATLTREKGEDTDDFFHRLMEERDRMEAMAREAEEHAFTEVYGTLENRRMSLVVRR